MNTTLDNLRYQNRSAPLEHKITFNELQSRPVGFQTAIPIDTTLEKMNSLEFKSMEGAIFEAASMASGQIRAEKQTEVMVDQAAAMNEISRTATAWAVKTGTGGRSCWIHRRGYRSLCFTHRSKP